MRGTTNTGIKELFNRSEGRFIVFEPTPPDVFGLARTAFFDAGEESTKRFSLFDQEPRPVLTHAVLGPLAFGRDDDEERF